jgi:predicted transposase/invertase (TIGR01784 family)
MNGNVKVNIEIQLTMEKYWSNRIMFYLCEEYTTGYRKGEGYDDVNIPKVVNISLLDVDYLKDEERVYNNFKIMNTRSGRVLTDKMDIHIIELSKLDRVTAEEEAEHKDILKWARFISAASWSEYEKYGKEDGAMAEAVKELRKINADEIERLRYLHREIAIRDEQQRKIDEERSKKEAEKIKKESEEIKKESEEIKKESEEIKKESEEIKKKSEEMKKESEKAIKIIEETERKLEEEKKKRKEMEEEYNKMKEMYEAMLQNQK